MGQVSMQSLSRKHKLNTRISTEAELVVVIDSSVSFFGRCYLLNEKGTILTKTFFIKTKRVQLCWRLMVKVVQVIEAGR